MQKDLSSTKREGLFLDKELETGPIGSVGELRMEDGGLIVETVQQSSGNIIRVALFQASPCAQVSIPHGEDCLESILPAWIESRLLDQPWGCIILLFLQLEEERLTGYPF